ncbi:MAG: DUF4249 family protein [Cyclobacteriaceae bacterium]
MKNYFSVLVMILLSFSSCIEEFNTGITEGPKRLVVEGGITTKPGPYTIKLSQTERFDTPFSDSTFLPITTAVVSIFDDLGNGEILEQRRPDQYVTKIGGLKGEVGRSYQLRIVLDENRIYTSTPELIEPVSSIDTVFYTMEQQQTLPFIPFIMSPPPLINFHPRTGRGIGLETPDPSVYLRNLTPDLFERPSYLVYQSCPPSVDAPGHEGGFLISPRPSLDELVIHTATTDLPGQLNYYRWNTKLTFQVQTYPEMFTLRGFQIMLQGDQFVACDNYVRFPKQCCSDCWVSVNFPSIHTDSDFNKDGGTYDITLDRIPVNNFHFQDRMFVEVEQTSLSPNAYIYFNGLSQQIDQVGGLFDKTPAQAAGNIINESNPDDLVLGYFTASDISSKGFYFNVEDLDLDGDGMSSLLFPPLSNPIFSFQLPQNNYVFSDDCRALSNGFMNSTAEMPEWWLSR